MVVEEEAADHPGNHREVEAKEDQVDREVPEDQVAAQGVTAVMAKFPGLH